VLPVNETTVEITPEVDMHGMNKEVTQLEDSRDGCGKTVVGQVGWDGMKG
jgi:hypothetical protein